MKEKEKTPLVVIKRLSRYRRYLEDLKKSGVERISSNELSRMLGYTASQIRQDLNNFGGFGQQGYGYNIGALYNEIGSILALDREYKMVLVGCGNLGQAIANYYKYFKEGFVVVAMFDTNPSLIGLMMNEVEIIDARLLADYLSKNMIDIGIICTEKGAAQGIADTLAGGGVRGIWNFAPIDLEVPDDVCVQNVHVSDTLQMLAYHINTHYYMEDNIWEMHGIESE